MIRILLFLLALVATAQAQSGSPLPSGYLSVAGNQFVDGSGNNVRIAATGYRGTPSDATTMAAIRSAGFNTIVLPWRDCYLPGAAGCTVFDDEFTALPLHQNWTSGDNWGIGATFDNGLGQGGPVLGDFGHQWWVNPFNPSTSFTSCGTNCYANGLYQIAGGTLLLGLLPTPSTMQTYINTQSQCATTPNPSVCADAGNGFGTLPYIGAIVNNQNTSTRQFGYHEIKVAVDKLPGFDFQWDLESYNGTTNTNNPPEIDFEIYTDGSGVMHTTMRIADSYNPCCTFTTLYDVTSPGFDPSVAHIYGIDWQSSGITFYVDGTQQGTVAMSALPAVYASGNPMFGYLLSAANYHSGVDPAVASLPVYAHVDYYRVYATKPTGTGIANGLGCNTLVDLDTCVSSATTAGLKVILSHRGNEVPTGACASIQQNGLWFDSGGSSGGADGCSTTGNVDYATFKQNTVSLLQRYKNNSTVIGYELHHAPLVDGVFTGKPAVSSGGGGTGNVNFTISGSQMLAPNGSVFHAYGVNITDDELSNATPAQVLAAFPKLNMIRLAAGADCGPPLGFGCAQSNATIEAGARAYTAKNILVMIESHECNGGVPNANQINATDEYNWYHQLALDLKDDPFVMFESGNECGTPGITAENLNVYNAVRDAGNNTPVAFQDSFAGGNPDGPASTYNSMSNVLWTQHAYNHNTGATTDQATANADFAGWVSQGVNYTTTKTGRMPTIFSEVGFIDYANACGGQNGPGTAGKEFQCGTGQVVTAALSPASEGTGAVGGDIWLWYYPPCCAQQTDLIDRNNVPSKTSYGNIVANVIAANSPGQASSGGGGGGTGTFSVSGGKIIGPDGNQFIAYGLNVCDWTMSTATSGKDIEKISVSLLQTLLPKVNFIRLAVGCLAGGWPDGESITNIETWVSQVTAQHIVVEIESHYTGQPNANQIDLTGEANWYKTLAGDLKSNPYVWFGTGNELGTTGLTAEHKNVYNAVRNAGNNSIIMLTTASGNPMPNGGTPDGPASSYNTMTNVVWDQHWYNWMTGGTTNTTTINTTLNNDIASAQSYTTESGGGTIPVLLGELGMDNLVGGAGCPNNISGGCGSSQNAIVGMSVKATNLNVPGMGQENLSGNNSTGFGFWMAWTSCCQNEAVIELDVTPATLTDVSSVRTVPVGQIVNLYISQGSGPVTGGGGGSGAPNPAVSWGGGGDTDILLACSDVGKAVNAANPGAILFCPGPLNNGTALLSGATKP